MKNEWMKEEWLVKEWMKKEWKTKARKVNKGINGKKKIYRNGWMNKCNKEKNVNWKN